MGERTLEVIRLGGAIDAYPPGSYFKVYMAFLLVYEPNTVLPIAAYPESRVAKVSYR